MEYLKSLGLLLLGIIKRLYYLIPSLFTDPFDFLERWFKVNYESPQWLFGVLLSLGIIIAIALAYHEIRMQKVSLEKRLGDRTKNKTIRETLARFLNEGNQFTPIDQSKEPPKEEAEDWANRVAEYLKESLGDDYVASFYDSHGLPPGLTFLSSPPHQNIEAFIKNRLSRIQQFLTELRN